MEIYNVTHSRLWQIIQDTVNTEYSWGWNNVDDYPNLQCCLFEKDWLTNIISCNDLERISANTPVIIAAQTGIGKTTLVFEHMLPIALREGKKVLYLSNRILLGRQMKQRCMEDKLNGVQYVGGVQVRDFPTCFTEKYIKASTKFGGIEVYSYQSFLYRHSEIDPNEYAFVVMDESHAFVADATYNVFTEEILDILINKFGAIRRIYLTATPQECLDAIYLKERLFFENKKGMKCPLMMKVYVVCEDYRYLLPRFFDSKQYIVDKIRNSSEIEKWIIFVRDKKTGSELMSDLQGLPGGSMYLTAECDKEDVLFQELIAKENLPKRVLITTRVLDVGVSIKTANLRMVIFETDIVEVKQMVGRKRIKPNEVIEVYFHIPSYKALKKRHAQNSQELFRQKEVVRNIEQVKMGYANDLSKYYPLYFHNGIKANYLSISKYQYDNRWYEELLDRLSPFENDESEYQKQYATLWLKNFEGQTYDSSMMPEMFEKQTFSNETLERVRKLTNQFIGRVITREQLTLYSEQLEEIVGDCRSANRNDRGHMKYNSLSKLLPQYGYSISSNKTNPVTYRIEILSGKE